MKISLNWRLSAGRNTRCAAAYAGQRGIESWGAWIMDNIPRRAGRLIFYGLIVFLSSTVIVSNNFFAEMLFNFRYAYIVVSILTFLQPLGILLLALGIALLPLGEIWNTFIQLGSRLEQPQIFDESRIENVLPESDSYFDRLVNINIRHLNDYYRLVSEQTDKSFGLSRSVSLVGFGFILIGLVVGLAVPDNQRLVAYLTTAAGILINFISSIFFYLYNRTVRQLKEYHTSLIQVQNVLLSFKIIEDISVDDGKHDITKQMIEFLILQQIKEAEAKKTQDAVTTDTQPRDQNNADGSK